MCAHSQSMTGANECTLDAKHPEDTLCRSHPASVYTPFAFKPRLRPELELRASLCSLRLNACFKRITFQSQGFVLSRL
ncbi:unnamed protein product [Ixodes pacificus]